MHTEEERDVLPKGVKLVQLWVAGAEHVYANLAVGLDDKRRFRFPVGVICRQEIGEHFPVAINRINRFPEEPGFAAKLPDCLPVGGPIAAYDERLFH